MFCCDFQVGCGALDLLQGGKKNKQKLILLRRLDLTELHSKKKLYLLKISVFFLILYCWGSFIFFHPTDLPCAQLIAPNLKPNL